MRMCWILIVNVMFIVGSEYDISNYLCYKIYYSYKGGCMNVFDLKNKEAGRTCVVVGAGYTLKLYEKQIKKFINKDKVFTIGINNMSMFVKPDYHMWTNNDRFKTFGKTISSDSTLILGSKLKKNIIDTVGMPYYKIDYLDRFKHKMGIDNKIVKGKFRTCGNLAIFVAQKILGAENVYCVGFDGYTLAFEDKKFKQHCYGDKFSDSTDYEYEKEKDDIVYKVFDELKSVGVNFKIITPTAFKRHYLEGVL